MTACIVQVNTTDAAEARRIGRVVVEERLAAAANVIDGVASIFHWDGAVREAAEAILILKTREDLASAVCARVKELHGYECPGVAVLQIAGGNRDYLDWIERETR